MLVDAVAPGFVATRMSVVDGKDELESEWFTDVYIKYGKIPIRRYAMPDEIAQHVAWLGSERNTYLTGQVVTVDGGLTGSFLMLPRPPKGDHARGVGRCGYARRCASVGGDVADRVRTRDESGPSPSRSLPAIAVVPTAAPVLVVCEDEAEPASRPAARSRPTPPSGSGRSTRSAAPRGRWSAARGLLGRDRHGTLPAALAADVDWVDVRDELVTARAVKDPDEVESIRAAIAVCDAGQRAARAHAAAGITELELWAAVRAAMESAAGTRLPVLANGPRGGPAHGGDRWPAERVRVVEGGDLVLLPIRTRVGAAGATRAPPSPSASPAPRRVRPTPVPARCSPTSSPRSDPEWWPAIWTPWRGRSSSSRTTRATDSERDTEEPRLVPGFAAVLEAGMVVAMEPGTYAGVGVRVEQVVLVTAEGCEVLSGHDLSL